ncbi:MAG: hypothetical protein RLZZ165_1691 [Bacteroidota bacterium]
MPSHTSPFKRLDIRWLAAVLMVATHCAAQVPSFPLSTDSDRDCRPCYDTVKVLMFKKVFDLSFLFPEWVPVVSWAHIEEAEGVVVPSSKAYTGTHLSQEDFSLYHYTHDFSFNILPDSAYRRLLARRVYTGHEIGHSGGADTILQTYLHMEWESGLCASNEVNPCAEANRRGESCGFGSAGHLRGEVIWNWPTIGDWVHCEGVWNWDRGHPPAFTELHPLRLMAIRRALGAYIPRYEGAPDSLFATRIDIYANGDGGALYNNRKDQPDFVHKTAMNAKDYIFTVHPNVPCPSPNARLRWRSVIHHGDNFSGSFQVLPQDSFLNFKIEWIGHPETDVVARTVYCWWEDEAGAIFQPEFEAYDLRFQSLYFNHRKEPGSRPEKVIWLEAGGQYLCLNELVDGEDIFADGEAKTYDRRWEIGRTFRIYGRKGQRFRVHVGGWENDGFSQTYGNLMDPLAPCDEATKKAFLRTLWAATPFALGGCLDDLIGEVHEFYEIGKIGNHAEFEAMSTGSDMEREQCPGANVSQHDIFRVWYSLRRVK